MSAVAIIISVLSYINIEKKNQKMKGTTGDTGDKCTTGDKGATGDKGENGTTFTGACNSDVDCRYQMSCDRCTDNFKCTLTSGGEATCDSL